MSVPNRTRKIQPEGSRAMRPRQEEGRERRAFRIEIRPSALKMPFKGWPQVRPPRRSFHWSLNSSPGRKTKVRGDLPRAKAEPWKFRDRRGGPRRSREGMSPVRRAIQSWKAVWIRAPSKERALFRNQLSRPREATRGLRRCPPRWRSHCSSGSPGRRGGPGSDGKGRLPKALEIFSSPWKVRVPRGDETSRKNLEGSWGTRRRGESLGIGPLAPGREDGGGEKAHPPRRASAPKAQSLSFPFPKAQVPPVSLALPRAGGRILSSFGFSFSLF